MGYICRLTENFLNIDCRLTKQINMLSPPFKLLTLRISTPLSVSLLLLQIYLLHQPWAIIMAFRRLLDLHHRITVIPSHTTMTMAWINQRVWHMLVSLISCTVRPLHSLYLRWAKQLQWLTTQVTPLLDHSHLSLFPLLQRGTCHIPSALPSHSLPTSPTWHSTLQSHTTPTSLPTPRSSPLRSHTKLALHTKAPFLIPIRTCIQVHQRQPSNGPHLPT